MQEKKQYARFKKPTWSPPDWVFGPVWTILYTIIAISFGYVAYLYVQGILPFVVLLPFLLNLIFNLLFTPILFGKKDFNLAALDVVLTWISLAWALVVIYPYVSWVSIVNIPYILWVSFASVLQITVTRMNRS